MLQTFFSFPSQTNIYTAINLPAGYSIEARPRRHSSYSNLFGFVELCFQVNVVPISYSAEYIYNYVQAWPQLINKETKTFSPFYHLVLNHQFKATISDWYMLTVIKFTISMNFLSFCATEWILIDTHKRWLYKLTPVQRKTQLVWMALLKKVIHLLLEIIGWFGKCD